MNDSPSDQRQFERGLRRILWELREYSNDLVLIGGWVPYLYREYGGFAKWHSSLSQTTELDVLIASSLETRGRRAISTILTKAGLRPVGEASSAAIWTGEAAYGEEIEFLIPHSGTARQIGQSRPIEKQAGLSAISLPYLELLRDRTNTLVLPMNLESQKKTALEIRVPLLGAYMANKATTFMKRSADRSTPVPGSPKKAKDLLYIRDLTAAGEDVVRSIEKDCAQLRNHSDAARHHVDYAANNLALVLSEGFFGLINEAAEILAERDNAPHHNALADLRGHLSDAREILAGT